MLAKRKMFLTELIRQVGLTLSNLSVLKRGKRKGAANGDAGVYLQGAGLSAGRFAGIPSLKIHPHTKT